MSKTRAIDEIVPATDIRACTVLQQLVEAGRKVFVLERQSAR